MSLRRLLGMVAWLALLCGVIVGFSRLGSGPLGAPPVTAPATWPAWAAAREPTVVVVAALRVAVLAIAWYLLAVSVVGAVARATRRARLVRMADVVTVPAVRRLLQSLLGVSLVATPVAGSAAPALADLDPPAMIVLDREPSERVPAAPLVLPRVARGPAEVPPPVVADAPPELAPDEARATAAAGARHTVAAGEHFWSIAAQVVSDHLGRAATDAEVRPYWQALVEHNQSRLADPNNPDLVLPGQEFELPPVNHLPEP